MNIAFLINNDYAEQLSVALTSLLINLKKDEDINVFVFNTGLSELNKQKLKNINCGKKYNMEFIWSDETQFKDLPTAIHLKRLDYIRMLFPTLLDCDKLLYLDSDILVFNDIADYYNTEFEDNYAVVIRDRWAHSFQIENHMSKLGVLNYFNAGVMLLNLKKMREDSIQEECFSFIKNYPELTIFMEQCVFNKVFKNKVKFIDKKYNFQYKLNTSEKIYEEFYKIHGFPHIIHFVGHEKPFGGYAHPFENKYFEILKKTPYKISFFKFKSRMWKKLLKKLKKRIVIILKCMI